MPCESVFGISEDIFTGPFLFLVYNDIIFQKPNLNPTRKGGCERDLFHTQKMKKKILCIALSCISLIASLSFADFNKNQTTDFFVNDKALIFDSQSGYPMKNPETLDFYLPLDATLKQLEAKAKGKTPSGQTLYTINNKDFYVQSKTEIVYGDYIYTIEPIMSFSQKTYINAFDLYVLLDYSAVYYPNNDIHRAVSRNRVPYKWKTGSEKVGMPIKIPVYKIKSASSKYPGYSLLSGFPMEKAYNIYVRSDILDTQNADYICEPITQRSDNDVAKFTFLGRTYNTTRAKAYALMSLYSELDIYSAGGFDGKFVDQYFDDSEMSNAAGSIVRDYMDGIYKPNKINFKIHESDWITETWLSKKFHLKLTNDDYRDSGYYLAWQNPDLDIGYKYPLYDFIRFENGFFESNNIRMIAQNGQLRFYVPDIENYVIPLMNGFIEPLVATQSKYYTGKEIEKKYKFSYSEKELYGAPDFMSCKFTPKDFNESELFSYELDQIDTRILNKEQTVNGVKILYNGDGQLLFNKESFDGTVVKLYQEKKAEAIAFQSQWASKRDLKNTFGIALEEDYRSSEENENAIQYVLISKDKTLLLKHFFSDHLTKTGLFTYNGIRVNIISSEEFYFNVPDLISAGFKKK